MRTETEWKKFAQYVPVGAKIQFRYGDTILDGVLLENYPHYQRERDPQSQWDFLRVKFDHHPDDGEILADYEYFQVADPSNPGDDTWYTFDDIMMFEDEPLPFQDGPDDYDYPY